MSKFCFVSKVAVFERHLRSNENFLAHKKLSCPIADTGQLTQTTHMRQSELR